MKRYFIIDAKRIEFSTDTKKYTIDTDVKRNEISIIDAERYKVIKDNSPVVVASVKFTDEGEPLWLNFVDVIRDGITGLIPSDSDIVDEILENSDDSALIDYLDEKSVFEFEGIDFDADYYTPYKSIFEFDPENPANPLIRFLLSLSSCPTEEADGLIALAKGKYIDEVDLPMNDMEKSFLKDLEFINELTEEDILNEEMHGF